MAGTPRPQSAPYHDYDGHVTRARVLSMGADDRYDPDAITEVGSRRGSYQSSEPLEEPTARTTDKDVDNAAERCDGRTSDAAAESQDIPRQHAQPPTGPDSPGYIRMAITRTHILPLEKIFVLVSILVLASCQSLDNFMRVLWQVSNVSRPQACN